MAAVSPLLGLGMALSGVPKAISAGRQAGTDQHNKEQDRKIALADHKLNREMAYQKKKLMDFQLAQAGRADALAQTTQEDQAALLQQQLQVQQQQQTQLSNKLLQQDTFTALGNFFDSGDTRSMNQFFKDNQNNSVAQSLFKGVVRMEPLNLASQSDKQLLLESGVSQEELDKADGKSDGQIDWTKLSKRYVKSIRGDGEVKVTDMLMLASATGYSKYADQQKLDKMKKLADIQKSLNPGTKATSMVQNADAVAEARTAQANGTATPAQLELITMANRKNVIPGSGKTTDQRNAAQFAKATTAVANGTATPADRAFIKLMEKDIGGVDVGKETLANDARKQWKAHGFDNLSAEELQKNDTARHIVNRIEIAHGLSPADRKSLTDLNSMIALSSEAGDLSSSQTGVWDRLTNNLSNYYSERVDDKARRATYGAFMNQFRHNLFGSALTPGELAAFKEAYGGLDQKIGPVLAGLRAAAIQVKAKVDTITNFNDPIVMKFHAQGKSQKEIQQALAGIDQRIKFYDLVSSGKTPDEAAAELSKPTIGADSSVEDVTAALGL